MVGNLTDNKLPHKRASLLFKTPQTRLDIPKTP